MKIHRILNQRIICQDILVLDFEGMSQRARSLYRTVLIVGAVAIAAGASFLASRHHGYLVPFLAITVPALVGTYFWSRSKSLGIPLLPLFLMQQAIVYGTPLVAGNPELEHVAEDTLSIASWSIGLFLICCGVSWAVTKRIGTSRPSKWNLSFTEGSGTLQRYFSLSLLLLSFAAIFRVSVQTGVIFDILSGGLYGLFPIIRTFGDAATMLGALLGGLIVGGQKRFPRRWMFWFLIVTIFIFSVASLLISSATGLVLATTIGLALGKRRIPWLFLIITLAVVAFLNEGKFVMREKYWNPDTEVVPVSIAGLPEYYAEWATASAGYLFGKKNPNDDLADLEEDEEGQSLGDRVNNLQNMTYVVEAVDQWQIPVLGGETYLLIPRLLIPRLFWPDKPRAHDGQILLNLHFLRQSNVEATETTYIAWGLLPEAVGNFGIWLGPIFFGLVVGGIVGWVERISLRKRVFSIEGMLLCALLLQTAASYEMVASIFLTSTFQLFIVVIVNGIILRKWFSQGSGVAAIRNMRRRKVEQEGSDARAAGRL